MLLKRIVCPFSDMAGLEEPAFLLLEKLRPFCFQASSLCCHQAPAPSTVNGTLKDVDVQITAKNHMNAVAATHLLLYPG